MAGGGTPRRQSPHPGKVRDAHGESFEILLPLRDDIGDYLARMAEAVHVLAEVEQRHVHGGCNSDLFG